MSIIQRFITFASLVWWPGSYTANAKKRLSRIQRLACLRIKGAMCTSPIGAMEALTGLLPLELVIHCEAAVLRLSSLGCWSYLHSSQGQSSMLVKLERSDPIFNIGFGVMRPAFNLNPNMSLH